MDDGSSDDRASGIWRRSAMARAGSTGAAVVADPASGPEASEGTVQHSLRGSVTGLGRGEQRQICECERVCELIDFTVNNKFGVCLRETMPLADHS